MLRVVGAVVACATALAPAPAAALLFRHRGHEGQLSLLSTGERVTAKSAEIALRREVDTFESEVGTMDATIFDVAARLGRASELLSAAPEANASAKVAAKAATTAKKAKNVTVAAKAKNVTALLHNEQRLLTDLFSHLKLNIKHFNEEEKSSKGQNSEVLKRLQDRLKRDQEKLKAGKLSKFEHEELVNRTRLEEHEVKYWSHGRELQHTLFHANLKLTHGLMARVKTVMEAYTQALSKGKVDPQLLKAMKGASLPKAFVEMRAELKGAAKHDRLHLLAQAQLIATDRLI